MKKPELCINCRHVKPLDDIVGRCLAEKNGVLFCKLEDPSHVCEQYKRIKKEDTT